MSVDEFAKQNKIQYLFVISNPLEELKLQENDL